MNTERELQLCAEGCELESLRTTGEGIWIVTTRLSPILPTMTDSDLLCAIHAAAARMGWGVRIVKRADGTGFIVFTKPCVLGSYDAEWTDSAELPATIKAFARVVEASRGE